MAVHLGANVKTIFRILVKTIMTFVILLLLVVGLFGYARYIEPNLMITNRFEIETTTKVEPFTIVFFSDTHFGEQYSQEKIEEMVKRINAEEPDYIVFGGDFLDSYYRDSARLDLTYLGEQLSRMEAKNKKIAIWGNHDYGGGTNRIYEDMFTGSGFVLLKNESIPIDNTNIVVKGLDDYLLGNPDTSTGELEEDNFNIILTHAPDIVDEMDMTNVDLVLAGHSHGGQVLLPYLTEAILPPGGQEYRKGIYNFQTGKDTKLYVTSGLGTTKIPFRFLNIPEIAVLNVKGQ